MITLSIKNHCALLLLFVLSTSLLAQKNTTFSKKITFLAADNSLNFGTKLFNANDGGCWLMTSCVGPDNIRVPTQILHFDSNWKITESKRTTIDNQRVFTTNTFAEMPNGNKVCLIRLDSFKYINNYGTYSLCIFDKNWKQIKSKSLNAVTNTNTEELRVDSNNNIYLITSAFQDEQVHKFDSNINLLWSKQIDDSFYHQDIIIKNDGKGFLLYYYPPKSNFLSAILDYDENGNLLNARGFQDYIYDLKILSNGNYIFSMSVSLDRNWTILDKNLNYVSGRKQVISGTRFIVPQKNGGFFVGYNGWDDKIRILHYNSKYELDKSILFDSDFGKPFSPVSYYASNFYFRGILTKEDGLAVSSRIESDKFDVNLLCLGPKLESPNCTGLPICVAESNFKPQIKTYKPKEFFYTVNITDNKDLCTWIDNPNVTFVDECTNPYDIFSKKAIIAPDSICETASINPSIAATTLPITNWAWNFEAANPLTSNAINPGNIIYDKAGIYKIKLIVGDAKCAPDTITKKIKILANPKITLPKDTVACNQKSIGIKVDFQGTQNWEWSDTKNNENPRIFSQDGIFSVKSKNKDCSTEKSIAVKFRNLDATFTASDSICETSDIQLKSLSTQTGQHDWTINPPIFKPENKDNPSSFILPAGQYSVTHTLQDIGCKVLTNKQINIFKPPTVNLGADLEIQKNTPFPLSPKVTPSNARFEWSDNATTLVRTISESGTYKLTARVAACEVSDEIKIIDAPNIYAPTIFAPKGNANTIFEIFGSKEVTPIGLEIYDRWGTLILNSDTMKWDGTYNGAAASEGTYIFIARFRKIFDNSILTKSGDVMLVY